MTNYGSLLGFVCEGMYFNIFRKYYFLIEEYTIIRIFKDYTFKEKIIFLMTECMNLVQIIIHVKYIYK